ncbi:MAG: hypothetical protein SYR96_36875 [Actinomycetota bacterium]|nr:hypothetical protein [Actinomycetota bacterium]
MCRVRGTNLDIVACRGHYDGK